MIQKDKSATLATHPDQTLFQPIVMNNQGGSTMQITQDIVNCLTAATNMNGNNRLAVCLNDQGGQSISVEENDISPTLRAESHQHEPVVATPVALRNRGLGKELEHGDPGDPAYATTTVQTDSMVAAPTVYGIGSYASNAWKSPNPNSGVYEAQTTKTLDLTGGNPSCNQGGMAVVEENYVVRRLTPTECARLQGFPDWWGSLPTKTDMTDEEVAFWNEDLRVKAEIEGKKPPKPMNKERCIKWYNKLHTDSAEYKMWGNGIALPPALYIMQGMAQCLT